MANEQIIAKGKQKLREVVRLFQLVKATPGQIEDWIDETLFECGVRGDSDERGCAVLDHHYDAFREERGVTC